MSACSHTPLIQLLEEQRGASVAAQEEEMLLSLSPFHMIKVTDSIQLKELHFSLRNFICVREAVRIHTIYVPNNINNIKENKHHTHNTSSIPEIVDKR